MSRKTDIENMWFAVKVNGETKRIQGKRLNTDLPDDAMMFGHIRGETKGITIFYMKDLSNLEYLDWWWVATQDVNGVHTTYRVNGVDMLNLFPPPELISVSITPNPATIEVGDQITLTASTAGIEASYYQWDDISSTYFSTVRQQDDYIILEAKAAVSQTNVKVTAYNSDANDSPVSTTGRITITVPDYTFPQPPQTPDNPYSCAWTAYFVNGWGIADGYQYILAPGGDGNRNYISVLDNKKGEFTQYVPKNIGGGTQLGGGFYWEGMFYILQGRTVTNPVMYSRRASDTRSWDEGWVSAQTVTGGVKANFGYSKWGVSSGMYGRTGTYYVMLPGRKTLSTQTFQQPILSNKKIWCVHSSDNGTTIVTDSEGNVYKMESLTSPSTAKKVFSWPGGTADDTGGMDIATDNKGTWMIAKRKQYSTSGIGGGIMISLNDGEGWTAMDPPGTGGKYRHVSGIAYGDGVWMCTMTELPWNTGVTRMAKSTDNGKNWRSISDSDQQQGQPQNGYWAVTYAGNGHWCYDVHTRETCFF